MQSRRRPIGSNDPESHWSSVTTFSPRRQRRSAPIALALLLAVIPSLTACAGVQNDAASDAHTALPAATSTPSPTPLPDSSTTAAPTFPIANPGAKVDAASQQKAEGWLAGAVVPPGAVKSTTQPVGAASGPGTDMWCQPMADAVGYWTLPSTSADDTLVWLESHASRGMNVYSVSGNARSGNASNVGGTVVDQPTPGSLEALIFSITPMGSGSAIRADAFTKAASSVCATAQPGTMLGIGG